MTTTSVLVGLGGGGYKVANSLRFRSSASAYLNRTPASATNRKTWTWSGWVKLGTLSVTRVLFGAGQNATTGIDFGFQSDNTFFYSINGVGSWSTTAVFRDPSAWYHVVFAFDSTQATQANRSIVYINGVSYSFASNGVVLNNNYDVNNNIAQYFAYSGVSGTPQYLDGYLAEVNFIDGQALTASSFGSYNTNGVWQPIKYSGSFGTNGFYLNFGNTTNTTTIGYDTSGNSNNWTANNISLASGTAYTTVGSTTWTAPAGVTSINYLVAAGGGGGGSNAGGGGGAGGLLTGTATVVPGTVYTIAVGGGGAGGSGGAGNAGTQGTASSISGSGFTTISATGGGAGQPYVVGTGATGGTGGSGGGGGGGTVAGGTGGSATSGQGSNGGSGGSSGFTNASSGGGGGAGAVGGNATSTLAGAGGIGLTSSINGTLTYYAGGGGGGTNGGTPASGGTGGGGAGASGNASAAGTAGTANTGGGGGGGAGTNGAGGAGGSGIIIINYGAVASTYDAMLDSPTPYSATVGNYAVFNSIFYSGGTKTLSNGNLTAAIAFSTTYPILAGTIGMSSGKWYWETTIVSVGSSATVGIGQNEVPSTVTSGGGSITSWFYTNTANIYHNAIQTAYGATFTTGDVIGAAFDAGAGTLTFYKNGVSQGVAATGIPTGTYYPYISNGGGTGPTMSVNFGQQPFTYTPPTGFNALNTYNLPTPTIANGAQYFAATTWTGNGTSGLAILNSQNNTIGTTFQPDLVWNKARSAALSNIWTDSLRGVNSQLFSDNALAAEARTDRLQSINSNGFTVGSYTDVNQNGTTFIGWQWKAGGASGVSNTNGSITSTVSANTTAGFSVVTYTGTGANATVGHGLGVAPNMIITKNRDSVTDWWVYHSSLGATQYIVLNTTAAAVTSASAWNNTAPTSTVFSLGAANPSNANRDVAYCWAAVAGYSAFGSYTGNASTDGTFVYTGFRPRWIILKDVPDATAWFMFDSSRDTYNVVGQYIQAQSSSTEATQASVDFLSNGFKLRVASDPNRAVQYIYAAFAENPFNSSRAR